MLKISEFAQLTNTTRRTLIIYDKNDLFKPAHVNEEGYRFYSYEQINELSFILALRKLGLSIDEIKNIISSDKQANNSESILLNLKSKINDQVSDLLKINKLINNRMEKVEKSNSFNLYHPFEYLNKEKFYWKSDNLANCSPQQMAHTFSQFYDHLDHFAGINGSNSGFLFDSPLSPTDHNFSLIKESNIPINDQLITTIKKPSGRYLVINIEKDNGTCHNNLHKGLKILKNIIADKKIMVLDKLWEIHLNESNIFSTSQTSISRLEIQILD